MGQRSGCLVPRKSNPNRFGGASVIWLVAEDEADIRVLITTMIQVWGHQAAAFENGQKVWDWLDKVESGDPATQPPELVLMDIRMPGKKGNELAARMRGLTAFAHTPIILMTAFSMTDAERAEMVDRDGVDRIIQKPLPEFDQLRRLLHEAIDARRAPPPATAVPAAAPLNAPAGEAAHPPEAPAPPESAREPEAPPADEPPQAEPQPVASDEKVSVPKTV